MASGQYLSMNPPEMIVDDIYKAGCFEIADKTLLGDEVTFVNIEGKVIYFSVLVIVLMMTNV